MAKKKMRSKRKVAGGRGRRKTAARATVKKKTRARRSTLGGVSTDALARELSRRQQAVRRLERRRDKLAAELEEIERELGELGGLGGVSIGGVRKRPRNEANLADSLAGVLRNKTMSVTEVADAVRQAGYRTSAENFRTIVNQTLIKDRRFKRVGRGQYTVR